MTTSKVYLWTPALLLTILNNYQTIAVVIWVLNNWTDNLSCWANYLTVLIDITLWSKRKWPYDALGVVVTYFSQERLALFRLKDFTILTTHWTLQLCLHHWKPSLSRHRHALLSDLTWVRGKLICVRKKWACYRFFTEQAPLDCIIIHRQKKKTVFCIQTFPFLV